MPAATTHFPRFAPLSFNPAPITHSRLPDDAAIGTTGFYRPHIMLSRRQQKPADQSDGRLMPHPNSSRS